MRRQWLPYATELKNDTAIGTPVKWYVYDGLGSVVGEVDPAGNMTASAKYDVYGAKRSGGTGTATSRQGFVGALGHVTDDETGLIYMRARYYDPAVGRFISEDPGKNGENWFAYCKNNSVNYADYTGKDLYNIGILMGEIEALTTKAAMLAFAAYLETKASLFQLTSLMERRIGEDEEAAAKETEGETASSAASVGEAAAGTMLGASIQSEFTVITLREVAALLREEADTME